MIGFMINGRVCFAHIAPLTTDGTIISNLEEFAALRTAFATVFALNEVGEYFGINEKDG